MRFNQAAAAVWDEAATAGSLTPKLSLFLLPSGSKKGVLRPGPPSTPPLNSLDVSVPFKWEEAPGKPRPRRQLLIDYEFVPGSTCGAAEEEADQSMSTTTGKGLKLPPRLVSSNSRRVSNIPSPTAGHNYPPPVKRCSSFTNGSGGGRVGFGSRRWGSFMTMKLGRKGKEDHDEVVDFEDGISSVESNDDHRINGAKIIRMRRRSRSLFNLCAQSRLANMYRSMKQVVIPGRRKE